MKTFLEQYIFENYKLFSNEKPVSLSFILMTGGHEKKFDKGKLVFLIFKNNESTPYLVAKFFRDDSGNESLKQEYYQVNKMISAGCQSLVKPICLQLINEKYVLFEKYFDGISLKKELYDFIPEKDNLEKLVRSHFDLAQNIINDLNQVNNKASFEELNREVNELVEKYFDNFNVDSNKKSLIQENIKQFLDATEEKNNYHRIINFDFTRCNILKNEKNECKIIDWEYLEDSTLLFLEPIRFFYYYVKDLFSLKIINSSFDSELQLFESLFYGVDSGIGNSANYFLKNTCQVENQRQFEKLMLIFFIKEAVVQYSVAENKSKDLIKFLNRPIDFVLSHCDYHLFKAQSEENLSREIIRKQDKELHDVYSSTSWMITGWFRAFLDKIKNIL